MNNSTERKQQQHSTVLSSNIIVWI